MENYKFRQRRLDAMYLACVAGTFLHGGGTIPEYLRTEFFNDYRSRGKGTSTPHRRPQPKRRLFARRMNSGRAFNARLRHH